jgi:hypothetical protein
MHFGKCIKEVIRAWNGEPRGRSDPLRLQFVVNQDVEVGCIHIRLEISS